MPFFFKRKDRSITNANPADSYEDVEGLITNLVLISALVLSFSVGLFYNIPPEDWLNGEFKLRLSTSAHFRNYVLDVMDKKDENWTSYYVTMRANYSEVYYPNRPDVFIGEFRHENFNIRAILQESNETCFTIGWNSRSSIPDICKKIFAAGNVLISRFPMDYLAAYCADHFWTSEFAIVYGSYSVSLMFTTLMGSFVLYVSLCLSPARERALLNDYRALNQWLKTAKPLTLLLYFQLALGVLFFFIGLICIGVLRLPCTEDVRTMIGPMYFQAIPSAVFSTFIAYLSWHQSRGWRTNRVDHGQPGKPKLALTAFCDELRRNPTFERLALDQMFAVHHITTGVLPSLSMEDLKEMGIQSVGIRKQLLAAILASGTLGSDLDSDLANSDPTNLDGTRKCAPDVADAAAPIGWAAAAALPMEGKSPGPASELTILPESHPSLSRGWAAEAWSESAAAPLSLSEPRSRPDDSASRG